MIDCGCHSLLSVCKGGLPLKFMDLRNSSVSSVNFTCPFVSCISSVAPCCRLHEHSYLPCGGRGMATRCIGEEYPCVKWCVLYILCSVIPWGKCMGIGVNVFADYKVNLLLLSGCKCGLVVTLWQTSETREDVMSHILLCCVVKPPMWQTMAWHTVNVAAQLHVWEVFVRLHSYLKHSKSLNSFCEGRRHDYHQFVSQPTPLHSNWSPWHLLWTLCLL